MATRHAVITGKPEGLCGRYQRDPWVPYRV